MDIVYIRELKVDTVIGVHAWERRRRQTLVLDLELGTDIRPSAAGDDVRLTLDYQQVGHRIRDVLRQAEYQLVETVAERLAALLQQEFQVPWLRLRVSKPGALRRARDVGVWIERGVRA